jgi:GTP cyclohydrolase I
VKLARLPERPSGPPDLPAMARAVEAFLLASGAALDGETRDTPERVARAWAEDFLGGYASDPVALLRSSLVRAPRPGELVVASQLEFHAMCPHHLLPYKGSASVGYVARRDLVGFGKIAAALEALAHRLILQEELAHQLCGAVATALQPEGVGVVISAEHGCMQVRGPRQRRSRITVEAWSGRFEEDRELRASVARRAEG